MAYVDENDVQVLAAEIKRLADGLYFPFVNISESGTDLDDYVTNGIYIFSSSSDVPQHVPDGTNGILLVISNLNPSNIRLKQIWFRLGTSDSNDHQTWIRTKPGTVWSSWHRLYTDSDTIPISNGGTGATTVAAARNALGLGNTDGPLPIAYGGTGSANVANARKALDMCYKANDTFSITEQADFSGFISSSSEKIYITIPVDKSLENVSSVTVTELMVQIRGVEGYIDSSNIINIISSADYSVTATKLSEHLVKIIITKVSDFVWTGTSTTVPNNRPVSVYATMALSFS